MASEREYPKVCSAAALRWVTRPDGVHGDDAVERFIQDRGAGLAFAARTSSAVSRSSCSVRSWKLSATWPTRPSRSRRGRSVRSAQTRPLDDPLPGWRAGARYQRGATWSFLPGVSDPRAHPDRPGGSHSTGGPDPKSSRYRRFASTDSPSALRTSRALGAFSKTPPSRLEASAFAAVAGVFTTNKNLMRRRGHRRPSPHRDRTRLRRRVGCSLS